MKKETILFGLAAISAFLLLRKDRVSLPPQSEQETEPFPNQNDFSEELDVTTVNYSDADKPYYGSRWKYNKPYGLPNTARSVVRDGDAHQYISYVTAENGDDAEFSYFMVLLAEHESGATMARPADIYDTRPTEQRPILQSGKRKRYVSAWGCFQFNEPAWRDLTRKIGWVSDYDLGEAALVISDTSSPSQATIYHEIALPLHRYRQVYKQALRRGFSKREALIIVGSLHANESIAKALYMAGKNWASVIDETSNPSWVRDEIIPMANTAMSYV